VFHLRLVHIFLPTAKYIVGAREGGVRLVGRGNILSSLVNFGYLQFQTIHDKNHMVAIFYSPLKGKRDEERK